MSSPYSDLDAYVAQPRLAGLRLSPDGTRLVTQVATLDAEATRHVDALWEVDPVGERPAVRLTRSAKGETGAAFLPDGGLLFTSARPDPDAKPADDAPPALWLLPAAGGEARVVGARPGGIGGVATAREAGTVVVLSDTLPASTDGEDDERRRKERKDKKVTAVLHTGYPVRSWDHDLGPAAPRLLTGEVPADGTATWQDLTPQPGRALDQADVSLTPDGRTAVTTWHVQEAHGSVRSTLVAVDTQTGERRVLLDVADLDVGSPVVSPDGTQVAVVAERRSTPDEPVDERVLVLPLDGSAPPRDVAPGWDRWGRGAQWLPDGSALVLVADDQGRAPVFRVDLTSGEVVRLTGDDAAYTDLQVSPDGAHVYALRNAVDAAPAPVRLDASASMQQPVLLPGPAAPEQLPGRVEEVLATAEDGTPLRAWLVLPEADGPVPLVLWIHGGPLGSSNAWSWRWNPWLLAAQGYAVLLADPALSTGYGLDFVRRGWGDWGGAPYTDLMRLTDAALERDDLDAERTGAMGGSFGGYMANWVAGHTDRFRAIVTHASLWDLTSFGPTTDGAYYWSREMTPDMAERNSPSAFADRIRTPLLVIHGDRDYRVPIGEGLALWWELCARAEDPATMPHRFLYFPDENHWVLTPQHAKIWYETVLGFLAQHLLGADEVVPDLLR